jgi:peptidyl-prolyl cis-trans isomerase C
VDSEQQAKDIIAKLKGGAKFEDLAKQSKDTGSASNGGDLDWAGPATFVPEFSKAMVGLQKGAITETPVKTQYGWHVIKLEDVRPAKFPSLEEAKGQIAEGLQQKQLAQFRESLLKKATIK